MSNWQIPLQLTLSLRLTSHTVYVTSLVSLYRTGNGLSRRAKGNGTGWVEGGGSAVHCYVGPNRKSKHQGAFFWKLWRLKRLIKKRTPKVKNQPENFSSPLILIIFRHGVVEFHKPDTKCDSILHSGKVFSKMGGRKQATVTIKTRYQNLSRWLAIVASLAIRHSLSLNLHSVDTIDHAA